MDSSELTVHGIAETPPRLSFPFPAALDCLAFAVLLLTGCSPSRPTPTVPLYQNLGTHSSPISSRVDLTRRYFDQGIRLTYAFNHAEAIRAFEEAARQDPNCAICHWGVALALGPNINAPMDSSSGVRAWEAIGRAKALIDHADERERALIDALAARYQAIPPADRVELDLGYAKAMAEVVRQFPSDLEAATLYAEALMDLRPWDYWEGVGRPRPATQPIVRELDRVMAADSSHPGACHYYIHLYEATEPRRALPCAERLAAEMPGAGHLVHMPAHIYVRVGRFREAIELNHHAAHADSAFAAVERVSPAYAAIYVPHNFHFLGFAALLAGRADEAIAAAKRTVETMPVDAAAAIPEYQPLLAFHHLVLQKFGRWTELLALPLPDTSLPVGRAVAEYARGTALAATGRFDDATALVGTIETRRAAVTSELGRTIIMLARHSLAGEVASRRKRWPDAVTAFRAALAIEDGFGYMEPPWWIEPVRHPLGMALLRAGKSAEAADLFREDLDRFPLNVWSLAGLTGALQAQGIRDSSVTNATSRAIEYAGWPVETAHP